MPTRPFVPVTDVVKIQANGTYNGGKFANIFHVKYSGTTPTVADLTTFANSFATQLTSGPCVGMDSTATYTELILTDLTSVSSARAIVAISKAGTHVATAGMPTQVSFVVGWTIARRYRGGHPRTYIAAQDQGNMANGINWITAWVTTVQNAMNSFLSGVNAITLGGATVQLGCVEYSTGHVLLTTGIFEPFSAAVGRVRICTQRRRLGKEVI